MNTQMPYGFGNIPNYQNMQPMFPNNYMIDYEDDKIEILEKKVKELEKRVKNLEMKNNHNNLPNNYNPYNSSMHMM